MKIVIELHTDRFPDHCQDPRGAAAQAARILRRLADGAADGSGAPITARGVVGNDLLALHDDRGVLVGTYTVHVDE
jgi:hypothetical protein